MNQGGEAQMQLLVGLQNQVHGLTEAMHQQEIVNINTTNVTNVQQIQAEHAATVQQINAQHNAEHTTIFRRNTWNMVCAVVGFTAIGIAVASTLPLTAPIAIAVGVTGAAIVVGGTWLSSLIWG